MYRLKLKNGITTDMDLPEELRGTLPEGPANPFVVCWAYGQVRHESDEEDGKNLM